MYKTDNKEYKDSRNNLFNMNSLNKPKSVSMDSIETLDTFESSYTIRSRTNSNSSGNSNGNNSRKSSFDIDLNADKKLNNYFIIDNKKEYIESNSIEIKPKKKRIRDEYLLPISKSPNINSILEKIPSLNLNMLKKNKQFDISNNIAEAK